MSLLDEIDQDHEIASARAALRGLIITLCWTLAIFVIVNCLLITNLIWRATS